ncbi:MAG: hypothetical protein DRJ47_08565 [Thermoprotei archaeon]|nr:MAG: hypothetical protein DRJ47_08565 [Thermoprotei archaeon]
MDVKLKKRILKLLKEDEEFRYAVAGLIGLEEILKRLDRHESELVRLREDMNKGFERHDKILEKHSRELVKLREDFNKLREDTNRLREDMNRLREDMNKGFQLIERRISALGARWGIMSEEAFRNGLKGLLEKELGLKVERWIHYDSEGLVYGYPSQVEVDVAIHDDKIILIEVSSHIKASDVYEFKRKAEFYEKSTGQKPSRLLMVTPYAEKQAFDASKHLGIEIYTKV